MEGLRGTTAVLFGGAGGIGSATSRRLAAEGANVVVASRTEANAEKVAAQVREADGNAVATAVDIGDETSVAAVVALALETYGGIDAVHVLSLIHI